MTSLSFSGEYSWTYTMPASFKRFLPVGVIVMLPISLVKVKLKKLICSLPVFEFSTLIRDFMLSKQHFFHSKVTPTQSYGRGVTSLPMSIQNLEGLSISGDSSI